MRSKIAVLAGMIGNKVVQKAGRKGTSLTGKIALAVKPDILKDFEKKCDKVALITGTNGKTTTNNLANHIFEGKDYDIVSNLNGSNMITGVTSSFIQNHQSHYDWGIFEVDEGSMPNVTRYLPSDYIIITNFFRDQLDRYGEVENTIKLVQKSSKRHNSTLILDADSPISLYFQDSNQPKVYYSLKKNPFSKNGINVEESVFCPVCGNKLDYEYINYGNHGKFSCSKCGAKNHEADYVIDDVTFKNGSYNFTVKDKKESAQINLNLLGIYNVSNALAAIALARENGFSYDVIKSQIENFEYKRGRMERIAVNGCDVVLVLSKNPVGLSEVFSTIKFDEDKKSFMFILNDYGPDSKDISWIWDAYFKEIANTPNIDKFYCVGTRAEEVALRLKYVDFPTSKIEIYHSKDQSDIAECVEEIVAENDKAYIIGTFTAMPEARKVLMKLKGEKA